MSMGYLDCIGAQKKGHISLRADGSHNKNLWIHPVYMDLEPSFGQVPEFLSLGFQFLWKIRLRSAADRSKGRCYFCAPVSLCACRHWPSLLLLAFLPVSVVDHLSFAPWVCSYLLVRLTNISCFFHLAHCFVSPPKFNRVSHPSLLSVENAMVFWWPPAFTRTFNKSLSRSDLMPFLTGIRLP